MNKIVTALVALVLLANSNGYAWDVPDEVGGGGAAYYDLDYGFNPQQYEAFVFDDNLYLFELGFTGPNWPDKEDQFGDIIPRDIFRDLINQCAGFGGPYTCQDFTRLVNKCNTGQFVNLNCIDLVERTNLINEAARQAIVAGCQTIGVCTAPPPPMAMRKDEKKKKQCS